MSCVLKAFNKETMSLSLKQPLCVLDYFMIALWRSFTKAYPFSTDSTTFKSIYIPFHSFPIMNFNGNLPYQVLRLENKLHRLQENLSDRIQEFRGKKAETQWQESKIAQGRQESGDEETKPDETLKRVKDQVQKKIKELKKASQITVLHP